MQKPHLVANEPVSQETPQPPKSEKGGKEPPSRQILIGAIGALIGVILGVMGSLIQENLSLSEHPPSVTISEVQAFSPEITIPNPNRPAPPAIIDQQIDVLHDRLGLSDQNMSIKDDEARALIDSTIAASLSLTPIETPLGYIQIDTWVANMRLAAKTITGFYTQKKFLEQVRATLDKALTPEQSRERFVQLMEHNSDHDNALGHLSLALQVNHDDATAKDIESYLNSPEFAAAPDVYRRVLMPTPNNLGDIGFPFGRAGIILRNKDNIGRAEGNARVALLIQKFDRDRLSNLTQLAITMLMNETGYLEAFLTESDKLVNKLIKPRIMLETAAFNSSRTPVTLTPEGKLTVDGLNNAHVDISVRLMEVLTGNDRAEAAGTSTPKPSDPNKGTTYATIESGKLARLRWQGDFTGTTDQWASLLKAWESGSLNCKLTVTTLGGKTSDSPAAAFGSTEKTGLFGAAKK